MIVPGWQEERYAEATLQSVFDQDCEAVEIVVVDDGSRSRVRDATRAFLQRGPVAARFSRIVFVEEGTASNCAPRRSIAGSRECRGDYINILEAGDAFAPTRFSRLLSACADERGRARFLAGRGGATRRRAWSGEAPLCTAFRTTIEFLPTVGYALLRSQCALSTANLFFSRRLAEHVGGFGDHDVAYGWDFALRSVLVSEPVFVPEPLYYYRVHGLEHLPERRGALARETESVLKNYFFLCRNRPVENPIAPSPAWGPFFASFVEALQYGKYLSKP